MQFAAPPFRIRCASLSDVGRVRSRNEDRCTCDPALRLLAVADGMGGHAAGDVASTLAIESLTSALQKSPRRNQLLHALGVSADLEVDLTTHTLQAGDRYLLCSDGLNGMLDEVHIAMLLGAAGPPEERARWLVDAANDNGGRDNVTVAIADVSNADLAIA